MKNLIVALLSGDNLKRKTKKEYKKQSKKFLVSVIFSYMANYDRLRGLYADKCIEIEYLNRRIKQLENRVMVLNPAGKYRNFRDIGKKLKKIKNLNRNNNYSKKETFK